jgi:hypothetical protein
MSDALADREVIIELHPYGNLVKISAFDVVSLTEISIQAPKGTSQDIMKRNALKRLEYVMRKKGLIS